MRAPDDFDDASPGDGSWLPAAQAPGPRAVVSAAVRRAQVFYPEATEERCTAALLLDVDPVGLVRRGGRSGGFALAEYVNDRPYVASSFCRVALVTVFKTRDGGHCKRL